MELGCGKTKFWPHTTYVALVIRVKQKVKPAGATNRQQELSSSPTSWNLESGTDLLSSLHFDWSPRLSSPAN